MQFDKPNNISGQLEKLKGGRASGLSPKAVKHIEASQEGEGGREPAGQVQGTMIEVEERFANLKSFHTYQLNDPSLNPLMSPSGDSGYNSPNALARIMSMYTGTGSHQKKSRTKPNIMREAYGIEEGIKVLDPREDAATIPKMKEMGWHGMCSTAQKSAQTHPPRFFDDIRPVATILRTKRSKRCRTCRHILVKPDSRIQSTRFRIRLVAHNYVPRVTLRPLQPGSIDFEALPPCKTMQVLLTLSNPLFDPVKITLATPTFTPGRFQSKITALCPQFEIGANSDVWGDALNEGGSKTEKGKRATGDANDGEKQAEAGKVWEKGRNWTTVVVEITTPSLDVALQGSGTASGSETSGGIEEDEDVLEIPMFVRIEYEAEPAGDDDGTVEKGRKERRELAYWTVLCVGRIV